MVVINFFVKAQVLDISGSDFATQVCGCWKKQEDNSKMLEQKPPPPPPTPSPYKLVPRTAGS